MSEPASTPSARKREVLERTYDYVLQHGLGDLSLRPLASAIGSSPRVLLFLFGSKDGLIRAVLERARTDELQLLERLRADGTPTIDVIAERIWRWLASEQHRGLLNLWVEGYARSLIDEQGPWADFARSTVQDWLDLLAAGQPARLRRTSAGAAQRTAALAVLRGAMLDLLATGDRARTTRAVHQLLRTLTAATERE